MKTPQINFRSPNVDRFIEIMVLVNKFGFNYKSCIRNGPKLYNSFYVSLDYVNSEIDESMFVNEHGTPEDCPINFYRLFNKQEIAEIINERIAKVVPFNYDSITDDSSKALLKAASEKLNLNKDQIQAIIDLSCVIASMENSKEIQAQHIAEAIQYIKHNNF